MPAAGTALAEQAHGWHLDQPQPGTMIWTTPSGRRYTTGPPATRSKPGRRATGET